MIPFVKTHALGNDFILVEQSSKVPADHSELARRICDRYFGIGADGLILWQAAGDSFTLRIFNRDGSEAECSGNGLRCVAAYLIESGRWQKNDIRLETISGVYRLRRTGRQYEADMGQPQLSPAAIPFIPPEPIERIVDYPLRANGRVFAITACSTGKTPTSNTWDHCWNGILRFHIGRTSNLSTSLTIAKSKSRFGSGASDGHTRRAQGPAAPQ